MSKLPTEIIQMISEYAPKEFILTCKYFHRTISSQIMKYKYASQSKLIQFCRRLENTSLISCYLGLLLPVLPADDIKFHTLNVFTLKCLWMRRQYLLPNSEEKIILHLCRRRNIDNIMFMLNSVSNDQEIELILSYSTNARVMLAILDLCYDRIKHIPIRPSKLSVYNKLVSLDYNFAAHKQLLVGIRDPHVFEALLKWRRKGKRVRIPIMYVTDELYEIAINTRRGINWRKLAHT